MDFKTLETIQTSTLLNLSTVHLKEKNYKIAIELSEQVNIIKEIFLNLVNSIFLYYNLKLL